MIDRSKLEKFSRKEYRDSYLQTQVRGGIAYQIQALREKFNMSQTEFAAKIDKKQSVVSRLEDTDYGKVTVQTLLDIACSLDVALIVRFASYPEFVLRTQDMSITALQPKTIYESLESTAAPAAKPVGGAIRIASTGSEQRDLSGALGFLSPDPLPSAPQLSDRYVQRSVAL